MCGRRRQFVRSRDGRHRRLVFDIVGLCAGRPLKDAIVSASTCPSCRAVMRRAAKLGRPAVRPRRSRPACGRRRPAESRRACCAVAPRHRMRGGDHGLRGDVPTQDVVERGSELFADEGGGHPPQRQGGQHLAEGRRRRHAGMLPSAPSDCPATPSGPPASSRPAGRDGFGDRRPVATPVAAWLRVKIAPVKRVSGSLLSA